MGESLTLRRRVRDEVLRDAAKAMVAFAQKVALRARSITQQDLEELRGHGLTCKAFQRTADDPRRQLAVAFQVASLTHDLMHSSSRKPPPPGRLTMSQTIASK